MCEDTLQRREPELTNHDAADDHTGHPAPRISFADLMVGRREIPVQLGGPLDARPEKCRRG